MHTEIDLQFMQPMIHLDDINLIIIGLDVYFGLDFERKLRRSVS
jgi:hypothetical protein